VDARSKVWLERDGRIALSDYRVRLLQLIDETGSLAEAAAAMKLSYRRAWGKVREIETNLGVRLVESAAGGAGGGGSRLTPEGERLVRLYARFREGAAQDLERRFRQVFGERRQSGP
jgi:molybdate transport system regulatory protein